MTHIHTMETVTYHDETPELSGYGDTVEVLFDEDGTIVIGKLRFMSHQLERMLNEHKRFKEVLDLFKGEN